MRGERSPAPASPPNTTRRAAFSQLFVRASTGRPQLYPSFSECCTHAVISNPPTPAHHLADVAGDAICTKRRYRAVLRRNVRRHSLCSLPASERVRAGVVRRYCGASGHRHNPPPTRCGHAYAMHLHTGRPRGAPPCRMQRLSPQQAHALHGSPLADVPVQRRIVRARSE